MAQVFSFGQMKQKQNGTSSVPLAEDFTSFNLLKMFVYLKRETKGVNSCLKHLITKKKEKENQLINLRKAVFSKATHPG